MELHRVWWKLLTFQRRVPPSSSELKHKPKKQAAGRVLLAWLTVMLKMAAVHNSEMSVNFNKTTQLHTPKDSTLLGDCYENCRSLIDPSVSL
jgi:hypothetical protein